MSHLPGNEDGRTDEQRDTAKVPIAGNILQRHSRQSAIRQAAQLSRFRLAQPPLRTAAAQIITHAPPAHRLAHQIAAGQLRLGNAGRAQPSLQPLHSRAHRFTSIYSNIVQVASRTAPRRRFDGGAAKIGNEPPWSRRQAA